MSIQAFYRRHTIPLTLLLVIFGAILLSMLIVSQRTLAYQEAVVTQLDDQLAFVQDLAVAASQNRANSAIGVSISDCPADERVTFDALLGRLDDGLEQTELRQLDQLFSACADVQAVRKAVVVAQLKREVQVLENYANQLSVLSGSDATEAYDISSWRMLVQYEETQRESMAALVESQREIISTLLDGKAADSPDMLSILAGVKEAQEALLSANTRAIAIRAELGAD